MARSVRLAQVLRGVCFAAWVSSPASASVIRTPTLVDIAATPFSFGFDPGSSDFTFSNTGESFFDRPVAVSTSGGGAVRTIFGTPSVDFDPPRNATPYDSSMIFTSFPTAAKIPFSGPPSFLGLADTTSDGIHYGFAEFYQNTFVGYAFESRAGVGIQPAPLVSPVPLPASAPMFGAAILSLGALGYGLSRRRASQSSSRASAAGIG